MKLKEKYTLGERTIEYVGVALGAVAPIVAGKYMMDTFVGASEDIQDELFKWGFSTCINVLASLIGGANTRPIPVHTAEIGGWLGEKLGAEPLRKRRLSNLEGKV